MSETPVRGVVVAHSDLAQALVSAVQRIVGVEEDAIVAMSNEGLGPTDMRERLDRLLGAGTAVVFADLREGSCGNVARMVCIGGGERALVTGVNLPMLLDFAMNRHRPLPELVSRLVEKGRAAITSGPE